MPIYWSLLLTLVLGMQTYTLNGQPKEQVDSLEAKMTEEPDFIKKSFILSKLAFMHMRTKPNKSLDYLNRALKVLPTDSLSYHADIYNFIGGTYGSMDSSSIAIGYLQKAQEIYQKLGKKEKAAMSEMNMATCHFKLRQYDLALKKAYKALSIYESINDQLNTSQVFTLLMAINMAQKDNEAALINAKKALTTFKKTRQGFTNSTLNYNVGIAYMELKQYDSAVYHIQNALKIDTENEYKSDMAVNLNTLATIYIEQNKIELATIYVNQAIELEEHIVLPINKVQTRINLAKIYFASKEYQKSIRTYQIALQRAQGLKHWEFELAIQEGLAETYAQMKDFENAHKHTTLMLPLKDSILNKDKQEQLNDLEIKYQTQYETEKKEQQNKLLTKDLAIQKLTNTRNKQQFYGLLVLFFLGGIISYLALRQYRARSTQQMLQLKHRLLRNQMNPHFIFNALIAIQNFVYKNDPRKAGKYLSSFAKLVRAILENSRSEYITLSKEIQWLENYLNLQLLRFNNKFDFDIQIDEELNLESVLIPPMLTQPFIENALEHGIKSIDYHGELVVKFTLQDNLLLVTVQDNGIGLSATDKIPEKEKHISLATTITRERLDFLNKKSKKKIHLEMTPIQPSGTLVSFSIPLNYIY